MYRTVSTQLMTIDEAMRQSELSAGPRGKFERPSLWAWQTVARAMAQSVTDEQLNAMACKNRKR